MRAPIANGDLTTVARQKSAINMGKSMISLYNLWLYDLPVDSRNTDLTDLPMRQVIDNRVKKQGDRRSAR
jgi:hypothetical protein